MSGSLQQAPMLAPGAQAMPQSPVAGPMPPQGPQQTPQISPQMLAQLQQALAARKQQAGVQAPNPTMPGQPGAPQQMPGPLPNPQLLAAAMAARGQQGTGGTMGVPSAPNLPQAGRNMPAGVNPNAMAPFAKQAMMQGQGQGQGQPAQHPSQQKMSPVEMAMKGRNGDSMVAHLTPGEIIVPKQVQTPQLQAMIAQAFEKAGGSLQPYVAGSNKVRINPQTGMAEFSWIEDLLAMGAITAATDGVGALAGAGLGAAGAGVDAATTAATDAAATTGLDAGTDAATSAGWDGVTNALDASSTAGSSIGTDAANLGQGIGGGLADTGTSAATTSAASPGLQTFAANTQAAANSSGGTAPGFASPSATGAGSTQQMLAATSGSPSGMTGGSDAGGDFGSATNTTNGTMSATAPSNPAAGNAAINAPNNSALTPGGSQVLSQTNPPTTNMFGPSVGSPTMTYGDNTASGLFGKVGNWFSNNPETAAKLGIAGVGGLGAAIAASRGNKKPSLPASFSQQMGPVQPNYNGAILKNGNQSTPTFAGYNPVQSVTSGQPYNFYNPSANTTYNQSA